MLRIAIFLCCCQLLVASCTSEGVGGQERTATGGESIPNAYATNFTLTKYANYTELTVVNDPWETLRYALYPREDSLPRNLDGLVAIAVPVKSVALTSTTDVPLLEAIGSEQAIVAFAGSKYVGSTRARTRIDSGKIAEIGGAGNLNVELLLELKPDLFIDYYLKGRTEQYDLLQRSGLPTLMDASWRERHPLGRAEWVKVIGAVFGKLNEAQAVFDSIRMDYEATTALAAKVQEQPTVLSGSLFKDVWYTPGGQSYMAQYFRDAGLTYLWNETKESGSLSLGLESVLDRGRSADIWITIVQDTSLMDLLATNDRYRLFEAANNNQVYNADKGRNTSGLPFYELGALRADLVLKDLVRIAHPDLLPDYETTFYRPLK